MIKKTLLIFLFIGTFHTAYPAGDSYRKIKLINTTQKAIDLTVLAKGITEESAAWGGADLLLGQNPHIVFSTNTNSRNITIHPQTVHTLVLELPENALDHLNYQWGVVFNPSSNYPIPQGEQPAMIICDSGHAWKEWEEIKSYFQPTSNS